MVAFLKSHIREYPWIITVHLISNLPKLANLKSNQVNFLLKVIAKFTKTTFLSLLSEKVYFCRMQSEISEDYKAFQKELVHIVENFSSEGQKFGNQKRNSLKTFTLGDETVNVKSFRVPHFINKIAYRFFRKSKAQRSFEFAHALLKKGIKTPYPIAYFQEKSGLFFGESYYISHHLKYDLTYRDLIHNKDYPDRDAILKAFTHFTFKLHENGVEFLDHSPGNTLIIKKDNGEYDFYLVDLNRMKFHDKMDYATRIKNFERLTPDKEMVRKMSQEYAVLIGKDFETVFKDMWAVTENFQKHHQRRRNLKKKLKSKK